MYMSPLFTCTSNREELELNLLHVLWLGCLLLVYNICAHMTVVIKPQSIIVNSSMNL